MLPYYGLAKGFLTGKYRPGGDAVDSARARGRRRLPRRPRRARCWRRSTRSRRRTTSPLAAVALAWLRARPHVVAPIASARTTEQLADILPAATLELTPDEVERLADAAAPVA